MSSHHSSGHCSFVRSRGLAALALSALVAGAPGAYAQEKVLNLYSARHYETDEALYADFTKQTGIRINRIEGGEDSLIERIRNEGARTPADVLITVDAGRMWRAEEAGRFRASNRTCWSRVFRRTCAIPTACGSDFQCARA